MLDREIVLSAQKRNPQQKAKDTRISGRIPSVVYGHNFQSLSIDIDYQEFRKAYRKTGDSTVLTLDIDGEKIATLVHDISYHPVSDEFLHIDFYKINEKETVKTNIPFRFIGTSPAVKNFSGTLVTPIDHIEIKCLPKYLIHDIEIDVSVIQDFHTAIHVSDLPIFQDKNIEVLTDGNTVVASVSAPRGASQEELEESSAETDNNEEKTK